MPPQAKSPMYSATWPGVGISTVQRSVVATCQKASSSSGTISASAVGFRRRHSVMATLAVGDLVRELGVQERLELGQLADLFEVQHVLGIGLGLALHGRVELPDILDVARAERLLDRGTVAAELLDGRV